MFKLVVIFGPNTGASYKLIEGHTYAGRQEDNGIVLVSNRVSKRHCSFSVHGKKVIVKDEGSSNGIFVNGRLTQSRPLRPGDRVSIGDFVLQLVEVRVQENLVSAASSGPTLDSNHLNMSDSHQAEAPPKDLKEKVIWFFNHTIMPIFYGLLMKNQWRSISLAFFGVYTVGSVLLAVYPLMESNQAGIIREVKARAQFMAHQISEQNASFMASGAETKADVGVTGQADGVRLAVLVDLDNRIIAPNSKLNQYLTEGAEAIAAIKARDLFRSGRETGWNTVDDDGMVVAVEPVKVLNPALGKNVVKAMAVVSIDSTLSTLGAGEIGVIYFETFILVVIFGLIIFAILYKLTLKPFLILNEDMDRALKGDLPQVTHEYQFEELNSLWEIINSAIQRIPQRSDSSSGLTSAGFDGGGGSSPEEFEGPIKMLGGVGKIGVIGFAGDRRINYMNPIFEEISGIRLDSAIGQLMASVARDQSLGLFTDELLGRSATGTEGASDDYEFSGMVYKVSASAFGTPGRSPKFYLMIFERKE